MIMAATITASTRHIMMVAKFSAIHANILTDSFQKLIFFVITWF